MKKRLMSMVLCLAMAASMTACGSSESGKATSETVSEATSEASSESAEEAGAEIEVEDYDLADCIELGDYKGLELTKTVEPVTDEDILISIIQLTGNKGEELTDENATVQMGDTANIDYEGKKDGVAFDGGTSTEPYDLLIGSGSFIPGFEEGVVGMKVGETKDINLTFPEDYSAADLAGQDVVFTVTLHSIYRLEITDEWVAENAGEDYSTAEAYIESNRETLVEQKEATARNQMYSDTWVLLMEKATFKSIPETLIAKKAAYYEEYYTSQASYYGYTLDDLIEAYGMTKEEFTEQKNDYGETAAKEQLLLEALMQAEGIEKGGQEYNDALEEMVAEAGASSADELIEAYGQDQIDDRLLSTIIVERVISYAKVTEN